MTNFGTLKRKVRRRYEHTLRSLYQKHVVDYYASVPKIFGIGLNKTGTTSLAKAMHELGYRVGHQRTAELMTKEWARRDFKSLTRYCHSADFFQDLPFSLPFTYMAMDQAFPNSKFILTIRDSAEQWYGSLVRFHTKLWGKSGNIPTKEDLQEAFYLYKGFPWDVNRWRKTTPENDPYNREGLIKSYLDHIEVVQYYFAHRPDDLLILNVSEKGAYQSLCEFLDKPYSGQDFPWENKT